MKSPALWGTEAHLRELFGNRIAALQAPSRHFVFRYRSAKHWLDTFRTYYGPMHKAFASLDAEKQASLTEDLLGLAQRMNRAADGALVVPSEYLEVVIKVR